jgi:hypothetical protein
VATSFQMARFHKIIYDYLRTGWDAIARSQNNNPEEGRSSSF